MKNVPLRIRAHRPLSQESPQGASLVKTTRVAGIFVSGQPLSTGQHRGTGVGPCPQGAGVVVALVE